MGHLHCLDAASGKVLWKKQPGVDYQIRVPTWGVASAPLVDGDLLIVQFGAADGGCLVALDKRTGDEKWRALDDPASYSAPIVIRQAGRRVLVCWTGENVVGLDPASGKVSWKHPFRQARMVINVPTPVVDEDRLFVSCFFDGALMLKLDRDELRVEQAWRRQGPSERNTDALHAMIGTPCMQGGYVYGVNSYGELRCLDAQDGRPDLGGPHRRAEGPLGNHSHGPQRPADVDVQRAGRAADRRPFPARLPRNQPGEAD